MDTVGELIGYGVLADLVFLLHFGFVLFVALGGFLLLWKRSVVWLHAPVALYGAAIEFFGWTCPLTPLENRYRALAGEATYVGGFIDQYLRGLLYPDAWTEIHVYLGVAVLVGNGLIYLWAFRYR